MTKYRQSAGWDMRDTTKPYLARSTEAVVLDTALVALQNTATIRLLDDFAGAAPGIWLKGDGTGVLFASNGGQRALETNGPVSGTGEARFAAHTGPNYCNTYTLSGDFATSGEWRWDMYTTTSGQNKKHLSFAFMSGSTTAYGAGNTYLLEVSGADMVTWKLIRTALWHGDNSADTVVGTFVATAKTTTWTTVKITRTSAGDFEIFQDGVSLGTATDSTYNTAGYIGISVNGVAGAGTTYIDNIYIPGSSANNIGVGNKTINYDGGLYTCWYTAGTAFAFTTHKANSPASNFPRIAHQNAKDIAVWARDETPTSDKNIYLVSVLGTTIRAYNGETQVWTQGLDIYATCVLPINSTTVVAIGTTAENNGIPAIQIIKMDAGAWTVASKLFLQADGGVSGTVCGSACLDSNGALYFATNDQTANYGTQPSRVFYISSTDLLATKPTITTMYTLSDFLVRGLFAFAGSVYIHGSRLRGINAYASVLKFPSTVMWESSLAKALYPTVEATKYNHGVAAVWKNLDSVLFLGMNSLASWDPILQMDADGNIREIASFNSGQFSTSDANCLGIAEWGNVIYLINAGSGTIRRTTTSRGALGSDFSYATLELSKMGANTDLINKTLYSVTVELSAAVPSGETLSVLVNDTVVGTMVNADGTRKEIVLTAELTASSFICKLRWPQASTWTGYISSGPLLKYVPTQFKKRAWGFGIRATKRLKYGDGTHESRTPATMFTDIEAAWSSNIPVTFIDVDGTSYSVLVTDFKQKRPLLQIDRQSEAEAFYFVELLQA